MPYEYTSNQGFPGPDKLKGKDLGVTLDIGGKQQIRDLRPDEEMAKKFGAVITDTMQTGISVGTKLPVVSDAVKAVADSPIGWTIGKAFDALNVPSWVSQQLGARFRLMVTGRESLPDDIRRMLESGKSMDDVADYMVNSQRAFSDSAEANLIFTMLLDPLNFTPLALGKVSALKGLQALGKFGKYGAAAVAGAQVAGPLGAVAAPIAVKAGAVGKLAKAAGIAGKAAEVAGPTARELRLATGQLSASDKVIQALQKERGLNLGQRIPAGARILKSIAELNAEKEKLDAEIAAKGIDPVLEAKQLEIGDKLRSANKALETEDAVTNPFVLGMYQGVLGAKDAAVRGAKPLAAALTMPASMAIPRALGGRKFNEVVDNILSQFPPELRHELEQQVGRGASDIAIIAAARLLANPSLAQAQSIAEATLRQFFDARNALTEARGAGQSLAMDIDNIAQEMINRANANGGLNRNLRISDTADGVTELKRRIKVIMDSDPGAFGNVQRVADPAKVALSNHIQDFYVSGELTNLARRQGGVERKVVDLMRDMGPDGLARIATEEVERRILQMTPDISSRASAYKLYIERVASMHGTTAEGATRGLLTPLQKSAADESFERIFGKFFNEQGQLKNAEAARGAAQAMVVADLGAYASANKVASRVNEALRKVLTLDAAGKERMIAELGEDGYAAALHAARLIGDSGVQIVREGFLFESTARALANVYDKIEEITSLGKQQIPVAAEQRQVLGAPVLREYTGTAADVDAVRRYVKETLTRLGQEGNFGKIDPRVNKLARRLNSRLAEAKDLDDVRRIWREVALESSEDMRAFFSTASDPALIRSHLRNAIDNGMTTAPLSSTELSALKRVLEAAGISPNFLAKFEGSRYTIIRAPKVPFRRSSELVLNPGVDDATKQIAWQSRVSPFVDMTNPVFAEEVGNLGQRYRASKIQEFMTTMFSPIGTGRVTNSIRTRMSSYLARGGITKQQVDRIMDELVFASIQDGVSARGLQRDKMELAFRNAFDKVEGAGSYDRFARRWTQNLADPRMAADGFNPMDAVMYAFQGDLGVVGGTQFITGRVKRWMPSIAGITDRMYPNLRFKSNPLYWIQEYIESPALNAARGVNGEVIRALDREGKILELTAGEVRDLSRVGPQVHEMIDNVNFLSVFRNKAIERAMTGDWSVPDRLTLGRAFRSGRMSDFLAERKEIARDALAADIAAKNFYNELAQNDPHLLNTLIAHYGTSDPKALFVRYLDGRRKLQNVEMVLSDIQASRPANMGWRRIPDRSGDRVASAKRSFFGGLEPDGSRYTAEDIFVDMHVNPEKYITELDRKIQDLSDAGYDPAMFEAEMSQLKANLLSIIEQRKYNSRFAMPQDISGLLATTPDEAALLARTRKSVNNLDIAFKKIADAREDANLRAAVISTMLLDTQQFSQGGRLTQEGVRIAEALALGHTYGPEISDFTSMVQRMVQEAKVEMGPAAQISLSSVEAAKRAKIIELVRTRARAAIESDPKLVDLLNDASYSLLAVHGNEEKIYRAFEHVYEKALKQANITTYFNPDRSLFERTINHPFLGFYPYSYMFKKILPEMINLLFKRPFGMQAPGAGYQAYRHVRDYFEHQMETDYTFRKLIQDNDEVAFMVTQLFPGVPWDISALPPSYLRAVASSLSGKDKEYTFENFLARDVIGSVGRIGPQGSITNAAGAANQIITQLSGGNNPKPSDYQLSPGSSDFNIYGRR